MYISSPDGVTRRPRENRSYNSRRSSTDSSEDGFNQNVRDLKQELKDMEEKFRKAMVTNASMDNEKSQLMFQVRIFRDSLGKNSYMILSLGGPSEGPGGGGGGAGGPGAEGAPRQVPRPRASEEGPRREREGGPAAAAGAH